MEFKVKIYDINNEEKINKETLNTVKNAKFFS